MPYSRFLSIVAYLVVALFSPASFCAPLDAFLHTHTNIQHAEISVSVDGMNDTLDVFNMASHYNYDDSQYNGGHLSAGAFVAKNTWIDGSLWQRHVAAGSLSADINSWQLAAQQRLFTLDSGLELALRAGAWGNSTHEVERRQSFNFGSTQTSSLHISHPDDLQWQIDLLATLPVTNALMFNSFISAGGSQVSFDKISGSGRYQGCDYQLYFYQSGYGGNLAAPCSEAVVITRYNKPYSSDDIHLYKELRYQSHFYQAGFNASYQLSSWQLKAGYVLYYTQRNDVDSRIKQRGEDIYNSNHTLMAAVHYSIWQSLAITVTGQYMRHQWLADIPFTYNGASAKHFDKPYGILSLGLTWTL